MSSSITGHIKIFEPSKCLAIDGATISASSGDSSSIYALDRNPDTRWRSVDSNDLTTETITVTFDENKTINRLFLVDINWKQFTVQYDNAGTWTNLSSVYGLDGSKASISETAFADNTAYYEFASVTTSGLRIQAVKTQTANQEKYISQIVATQEVGTFLGWPNISDVEVDRNIRSKKTLTGRYSVIKSLETVSFEMAFKDYPSTSTYNADIDLIMQLHDREDPFIVWLCGGRRGAYFNYILRGWRLKDLFTMQITKSFKLGYSRNIYKNPVNAKVTLEESI
jgi:hypothetical protein